MNAQVRIFKAEPAMLSEVPFLLGLIGPPGSGKSWSALRIASGMKRVRPGPVVLIDTERGRARKYARDFDFLHVPFDPPFVPEEFLHAVQQQLPLNPAAIIIDSLSDEHEGDGGVLDWHDRDVPNMGGNEWAAWAKPKASRRKMIGGFLQIKTPLIFTFRAREKTILTKNDRGKQVPTNIGYQPIAPLEIVYALDMTCILPPSSQGTPIWKSSKSGEDFIIKLPHYLAPFVRDGQQISEDMGEAFARWAKGETTTPAKIDHLAAGRAAAEDGMEKLREWYRKVPKSERSKELDKARDGEFIPRAEEVDAAASADGFGEDGS